MNKRLVVSLVALSLVSPGLLFAQENELIDTASTTSTNDTLPLPRNSVEETQRKIEEVRQGVLDKRNQLFSTFQDKREAVEEKKEALQAERQETRNLVQVNKEELLAERKARLEQLEAKRAQYQTQQQERKLEVSENIKARILTHREKVSTQFNSILLRFENHADFLEEKIEEFKERDIDTGTAEETLLTAREAIETARAEVDTALAALDTLTVSDSPRETLGEAQTILQGAKESLRSAHTSLTSVLKSLREAFADHNKEIESSTQL